MNERCVDLVKAYELINVGKFNKNGKNKKGNNKKTKKNFQYS